MTISYVTGANAQYSGIITKPGGIQTNDLLLLLTTEHNVTGALTCTGFNAIEAVQQEASQHIFRALYRVADGSEGATFTVAHTDVNNADYLLVYRGVDPVSPIDAYQATIGSNTASPQSLALTGVTDRKSVV